MYHEGKIYHSLEPVSKRIHVTLPDGTYQKLEAWAESEARPVANLASYLLQKVLEEAEEQGKIPGAGDRPK
jgi:hypothetical protein